MADVARVVCLLDDDESVRKSIARLLESSGFEVHAFGEPEALLEHVSAHQVPVAILDIWMGNMNGMQLLAHLCARSPSTRVIFITGRQVRAAQATVMQAGAFAFFIKPFDNNLFLEAVQNAFGQPPNKTEAQSNSNTRDSSLMTARTERSTRA